MKFILDNSILSSLAKIGRLHLLKNLEEVCTTEGVVYEALKSHIETIEKELEEALPTWLKVIPSEERLRLHKFRKMHPILSYVDSELILTAKRFNSSILTDDRILGLYAEEEWSIPVFDLESILLALRDMKVISRAEMRCIIEDLEKKDAYKFEEKKKRHLLGTL